MLNSKINEQPIESFQENMKLRDNDNLTKAYRPSDFPKLPTISTAGFSIPNSDSATFAKQPPSYITRTSEISRDSLAFKNSTEKLTGVPYKRVFIGNQDPRAARDPEKEKLLDKQFDVIESPKKKPRRKSVHKTIDILQITRSKFELQQETSGSKLDMISRAHSSIYSPYEESGSTTNTIIGTVYKTPEPKKKVNRYQSEVGGRFRNETPDFDVQSSNSFKSAMPIPYAKANRNLLSKSLSEPHSPYPDALLLPI